MKKTKSQQRVFELRINLFQEKIFENYYLGRITQELYLHQRRRLLNIYLNNKG